jgi:hypothetical protein
MKLCASPANTTCVYQRIARDQADPDDGAQAALAYENSASEPTNRRPSVAVRVACCR